MRKNCILILIAIIPLFINCSLHSDKVIIKPLGDSPEGSEKSVIRYDSFWDAMKNFDLGYTSRDLSSSEDQKKFEQALTAVVNGEFNQAENILADLYENTNDSTMKANSRQVLKDVYLHQSKWSKYLALETGADDDSLNTKALIQAYEKAPAEIYDFPKEQIELPMKIGLSGVPQVEVEVNGIRKWFWIDTGANYTVLASDFAEMCGIQAIGDADIKSGTSTEATVAIRPALIDTLKIGNLVIKNHPAMIIDKSDLEFKFLKFIRLIKIDGIVGWHAIKEMRLTMDYKKAQLVIEKPSKIADADRNLYWLGYPIMRFSTLSGAPLYFGLDNGANGTSIHTSILSKVDTTGITVEKTRIGGAGGQLNQYTVQSLPLLSLVLNNYQLTFKDINTHPEHDDTFFTLDGIAGSDIASEGTLVIDFVNGRADLIVSEENE